MLWVQCDGELQIGAILGLLFSYMDISSIFEGDWRFSLSIIEPYRLALQMKRTVLVNGFYLRRMGEIVWMAM